MRIKLWCSTHDRNSHEEEIIEVDDTCTDEEIEEMAKDFFYNAKEPAWGFERLEEEDED